MGLYTLRRYVLSRGRAAVLVLPLILIIFYPGRVGDLGVGSYPRVSHTPNIRF